MPSSVVIALGALLAFGTIGFAFVWFTSHPAKVSASQENPQIEMTAAHPVDAPTG